MKAIGFFATWWQRQTGDDQSPFDGESSAFEDLFFQGPPDQNNSRKNGQPIQSEGSGFIVRPDGYIAFRCSLSDAARLLPPYLERTLGALKTTGRAGRDEDRGSRVA